MIVDFERSKKEQFDYETMNALADELFRFVMLYRDYAAEKKDYGTGEMVSMVEVHTLRAIARQPGITVSELADQANRTKGAISQTLRKLEGMGYITKKPFALDGRVMNLFITERGETLDKAHFQYDTREVTETFEELRRYCTEEDLKAFYRVIKAYLKIFEEDG